MGCGPAWKVGKSESAPVRAEAVRTQGRAESAFSAGYCRNFAECGDGFYAP